MDINNWADTLTYYRECFGKTNQPAVTQPGPHVLANGQLDQYAHGLHGVDVPANGHLHCMHGELGTGLLGAFAYGLPNDPIGPLGANDDCHLPDPLKN